MKLVTKFSVAALIMYLFTACGVSNNQPTSSITKFPEGRSLYFSKCTACHRAYEPKLHTTSEWQIILNEMGSKAKLTVEEKDTILNYLTERN